jgi:TolB-like protein
LFLGDGLFKLGKRVASTAHLNDLLSGSHLSAQRYDRDLAEVYRTHCRQRGTQSGGLGEVVGWIS